MCVHILATPSLPGQGGPGVGPGKETEARARMGTPARLSCNLSFLGQGTSGGGYRRQRMHVGGLPTLHHRLAQDLQVRVGRVIGRGSRSPCGAAVLAGSEERAGSRGAHGEVLHFRPGGQGGGAAAGLQEAGWGGDCES